MSARTTLIATALVSVIAGAANAALLGEGPALGPLESRMTQSEIEAGGLSL